MSSLSLSQKAYDHIQQSIFSRRLKAGAVISEAAMAKELGLTRTPVGEAVRQLVNDGWVQVTYDACCDIGPNLTEPEKAKLLELLKEAREDAMDGGSADEKSAIFKESKGKIVNYLNAAGHDVTKAYKDWGERQKKKAAT